MPNFVLLENIEAGIAVVTMNRAERRNALNLGLLEQLCSVIGQLAEDEDERVMILRGAPPVFSAGMDLAEAADESRAARHASALHRTLGLLRDPRLVTIAAVQGGAFAGGAGMMAACDIVVCAEDAGIGFPELRRGLLPAMVAGVLRHRVCEGELRELLLAGSPINADRAQRIGLVQRVVPADRVMDEATKIARLVLEGAPRATRLTKEFINELYRESDKNEGQHFLEAHLKARRSAEAREGLAAFVEKRKPIWP
jgi:methylglutaconyl-CoA hydratase